MNQGAKIRSTPDNPDSDRPESDSAYPPETSRWPAFSTLGLHPGSRQLYAWAVRHHAVDALLLLVGTSLSHQRPSLFGTVLAEISSPKALELLESWSQINTEAEAVFRLAVAADTDPGILQLYPPLPRERQARRQLYGDLHSLYIIGMLAEQPAPDSGTQAQDWLLVLRLWVLVAAAARAKRGNLQDVLLRELASKLRMACQLTRPWPGMFERLRTGITEFDALARHLSSRAAFLAGELDPSAKGYSTKRKLYRYLERVAKGEHQPDKDGGSPATVFALAPPTSSADRGRKPVESELRSGDEESEVDAKLIQGDEDGVDLVVVGVDALRSYDHQRLAVGSVLLGAAEDAALLPWSWERPNPHELRALDAWIHGQLCSGLRDNRLLGALTWIALSAGRSLRRCLDIEIGADADAEWRLHPSGLRLHRQPPKRTSGWQPRTAVERAWVTPVAEAIPLPLPEPVVSVLMESLNHCPGASCLGELWQGAADQPETAFRTHMTGPLARVTPGMLAGALPQHAYLGTGDLAFARLLAAHPSTGLPAACAYASWSSQQAAAGLAPPGDTAALQHAVNALPRIGLGSRLDPLEDLVAAAVARAGRRLAERSLGPDLVAIHNAFSAYLTVALLAATGVRPIRDPLESSAVIDWDEGFLFVDDKATGELRQGRVVPLPRSLVDFLQSDYPDYLRRLAGVLAPLAPELAAEVLLLAQGRASGRLPFLFCLSTHPGIGWRSLSAKQIEVTGLFDWPLPANLLRHRLANQLRYRGLSEEIIDGMLGHAAPGAVSYGDYSPRCWADDARCARPALEAAFQALGFELGAPGQLPPLETEAEAQPPTRPAFGAAERARKRRLRHLHAVRDARLQIDAFLDGKALHELSAEQIDQLSRQLLFNPLGLPRPTGYLRYEYLMRGLQRAWEHEGKRVRIRKRYTLASRERSPFELEAPGAAARRRALLKALRQGVAGLAVSQTSIKRSLALGTLLLCLENRIADRRLLNDVIRGKQFRLVCWRSTAYLEYVAAGDRDDPDVPLQRYRIAADTAALFDRSLGAGYSLGGDGVPLTGPLQPLADVAARTVGAVESLGVGALIQRLVAIVDQANAVELPGLVGAYLGGRLESAALSWRDWVRLDSGNCLVLAAPEPEPEEDTAPSSVALPLVFSARRSGKRAADGDPAAESEALQATARSYFLAISASMPEKHEKARLNGPNVRRRLAREINQLCLDWSDRVSPAVLLLGQWVTALLFQRTRRAGRWEFIQFTSVRRYLSALSPAFQGTAYAADLVAADGPGVTEIYRELLSARAVKNPGFVAARLGEFHRWARGYGVSEPDWSELPQMRSGRLVAPGVITEREYQNALQLLIHQPEVDDGLRLAQAVLLVLAYRFGLRGDEALGLQRRDLLDQAQPWVVLVRNNRLRRLKSAPSRRQVPLLYPLSPLEHELLQRQRLVREAAAGRDPKAPLFCEQHREHAWRLTAAVIEALKRTTGNPRITLHHARHSAANRVDQALTPMQLPRWWQRLGDGAGSADSIAETLLGRVGVTRRAPWALARYLGHGGPGTAQRSYGHGLSDWCDGLIGIDGGVKPTRLRHAIWLDRMPTKAPLESGLLHAVTPPLAIPTPEWALSLMRLVALGKSPEAAGAALALDSAWVGQLLAAVRKIGAKQRLGKSKRSGSNPEDPTEFLRRITSDGWRRLLELTRLAKSRTGDAGRNEKPEPSLDLHLLVGMVGPTRQLLVWNRQQAALLHGAIESFGIPKNTYRIVPARTAKPALIALMTEIGLPPERPGTGRPVRVDPIATDESGDAMQRNRCALIIQQNRTEMVRSAIDFIPLLIAYASTRYRVGAVDRRTEDQP